MLDYDLTGDNFVADLLQKSKSPKPYVFVLSEKNDFQSKCKIKKQGASGWIIKPFIPEKLVKDINEFLNKK